MNIKRTVPAMFNAEYEKLLDIIRPYGKAVVAFSGGVDSTLLAYAAAEALGRENVLCVTARALWFPERELNEASVFCAEHEIHHAIVGFNIDDFSDNPPDRCYHCKAALFSLFKELAGDRSVFEGSNTDDKDDYRPGMRAVRELGVISPLCEAGFSKEDVRACLKELGLAAWDKPPMACLATRIPYGEEITAEKLHMIDRAEQFLLSKGFKQARVRMNGTRNYTARIEALPVDIAALAAKPLRDEIDYYYRSLGFTWVSLDLAGYRTGSMNEGIIQ